MSRGDGGDARRPFALVRPYPGLIRQRVLDFVAGLGLPFHVHRDRHGDFVDGTGVAALLTPAWPGRRVPILMPVSPAGAGLQPR